MHLPLCNCFAAGKRLEKEACEIVLDHKSDDVRETAQDLGELYIRAIVVTNKRNDPDGLAIALETAAAMLAYSSDQARLKKYARAYALLVLGADVLRRVSPEEELTRVWVTQQVPDVMVLASALVNGRSWAISHMDRSYWCLHEECVL